MLLTSRTNQHCLLRWPFNHPLHLCAIALTLMDKNSIFDTFTVIQSPRIKQCVKIALLIYWTPRKQQSTLVNSGFTPIRVNLTLLDSLEHLPLSYISVVWVDKQLAHQHLSTPDILHQTQHFITLQFTADHWLFLQTLSCREGIIWQMKHWNK